MEACDMTGQCVACIRPEAEYLASKVTKKNLSHEKAAAELGMDINDWVSHYELHVRQKLSTAIVNDVEGIKDSFLDKVKEGQASLNRLIKMTTSIHKKLEDKDIQSNLKLIQAYTALESNVIRGLKELAVLEGEIQTHTTINIQNNTVKVEKLMSTVLEVLPPKYQELILQKVESVEATYAN